MAITIAVINQKGGVGKTNTTVNLGIGLARRGKKVLLIDADSQGSLSNALGIAQPDELDETIAEVLEASMKGDSYDLDRVILRHEEGVDFIPGNIGLGSTELLMNTAVSRETLLRDSLEGVRDRYDFILIDCPPSLGIITYNSLVAADRCLIPVSAEYLAVKGMEILLTHVAIVRKKLNRRLLPAGILVTMHDARANVTREIESALEENFGSLGVFRTRIPFSRKQVNEANLRGISTFALDPRGSVARAYAEFTDEFLEKVEKEAQHG